MLERAALLRVGHAAEHLDAAAVDQQRRDLRLGGADDREPGRHVLAQRLERAHAAPAGPCAATAWPTKTISSGSPGARRRAAGAPPAGRSTPLGTIAVVAAVEAPARPLRGLRHRDPHGQVVELAPGAEQARDEVRRDALGVAVEGADERRVGRGQGVPADHRRHGLVQVHDVERARAQLAPQRADRRRRAGEVGDGAVERPADRAAQRHEPFRDGPRLRTRAAVQHGAAAIVAVVGREHAHVVARAQQARRRGPRCAA